MDMETLGLDAAAFAPASTLPDEEIVKRVRSGEQALFEILMRRHNQRIYRAARAVLKDENDVEDVMQQAYINAFTHLHQFEERSQFSTWLIRITLNEAFRRRRKVRQSEWLSSVRTDTDDYPGEFMDTITSPQPDPERQAYAQELHQVLEEAVDSLPETYRTVFMLRDIEGLSTSEAGEGLGLGEEAIKTRLHRARAMIRRAVMARLGEASTGAFQFQAPRCDRVVAAVMARIGRSWEAMTAGSRRRQQIRNRPARSRRTPPAAVASDEPHDTVDEASAESFPASDPPAWTLDIEPDTKPMKKKTRRSASRLMSWMTAAIGLTMLVVAPARGQQPAPVRTVDAVDLDRYVGDWFEIARLPAWFQRKCASDVRASYARRPDGRLDVVNRCRTADDKLSEARGVARLTDAPARLKVRFAPALLSFIPSVWGDYWILGLASDYSWAVVGSPDRNYLWILARKPALDEGQYASALSVARANGFAVERLIKTAHKHLE